MVGQQNDIEHAPIDIIAGPTASGKSDFALALAAERPSVIINADSMQVYDALHVLTAQPSAEEQAQHPHRLYACMHPKDSCSTTKWAEMAIVEIRAAREQSLRPIIVGGTGFYMKTLTHGLSPIPDVPEDIHLSILEESENALDALNAELQKNDPVTAERLDPANKQRIARAVEVFRATGKPLSWWQEQPAELMASDLRFSFTILQPDRAWLHDRINKRVPLMLEKGALDEVEALAGRIDAGEVPEHAGVVKAHGFRAFRDYLRGHKTLDDAIEYTQTETRQYAKRQDTWWRNQITEGDGLVVSVRKLALPD